MSKIVFKYFALAILNYGTFHQSFGQIDSLKLSVMIKESNETPKRKRRTKEEIQAARAAGEVPIKRVKKVVEKVDNQEARVSEDKPIKKVPIEQSVILMSCLNPTVAKVVINSAKENGVEVVLLEDSVLKDYVSRKSTCENKALETFLSDSSEATSTGKYLLLSKHGNKILLAARGARLSSSSKTIAFDLICPTKGAYSNTE